jgi:MFS family permease
MPPHYGAVLGIIGGVSLLQLANTVLSVALPLHLTLAGFSGITTGIVTTAYGVGFLAGCMVAHRLIRSVGHIRAFAVLAAVCAVLSMVFGASQHVAVWLVLRLVMGFCQAGLFTVVEGWLSAAAPPQARGGVLSFYLVSTKVAIVGAQILLGRVDAMALGWFDIASAVFTLSLVPVALTRTAQPPAPRLELLRPRDLYRVAPAGIVGCLCSGLLSSAVIGLAPVYGTFFLQWPLGRLSDRVDRRSVIAGCALAVAGLSALIVLAGERPWLLLPLVFLWGGASLTFYAVAIAHSSDFADPDQMVGVSSGSLLAWALGAAIGPSLAAPFLDLLGPKGLFLYALAVASGLAGFVLYRMTRRAPLPPEAREGFVDLPTTSPRLAEIDPRVPERPAA